MLTRSQIPIDDPPSVDLRVPARLPRGARLEPLTGRNPLLPTLYTIPKHPQIPHAKGKIILLVVDYSPEAMSDLHTYATNRKSPRDEVEMEKEGWFTLRPSNDDYVVMRDKYGTGKFADDKVVSWALAKSELDPDHIKAYEDLRALILGPESELCTGPQGTAFQRHPRAIPLAKAPGCYPVSLTVQVQRSLAAPAKANKVYTTKKDEDAQMRFDLIKLGARSSVKGLAKGPVGLVDVLTTQAELTNLPRIGVDGNVAHPSWQLNVADAISAPPPQPATRRRKKTVPPPDGVADDAKDNNIEDLGEFGGNHEDTYDGVGPPTNMTTLTAPHPDVPTQYFFLFDMGVCWELQEFSSAFFSGLNNHGGMAVRLNAQRTALDQIFKRLSLIGYPQGHIIDGQVAVAWAALPNNILLPIGRELRDPSTSHMLSTRSYCEQATFTSDSGSVMAPESILRHFSRCAVELLSETMRQLDPALLPRLDVQGFMNCITFNINGVRTAAPDWELAPGWRGEDTRPGKDVSSLLQQSFGQVDPTNLSIDQLLHACNSDNHTSEDPYGNPAITAALNGWHEYTNKASRNIPICVVNGEGQAALGGRPAAQILAANRKAINNAARSADPVKARKNREKRAAEKAKKAAANAKKVEKAQAGQKRSKSDSDRPSKRPRRGAPESDDEDEDDESEDDDTENDEYEEEGEVEGHASNSCDSRLLNTLTLPMLESLKQTAEKAQVESSSSVQSVSQALLTLIDNPLGTDTRRHAQGFTQSLSNAQVGVWAEKADALMLSILLWEWLERQLVEAYDASEAHGLTLLLAECGEIMRDGKQRDIDASDYLDGFLAGECTYTFNILRLNRASVNRRIIIDKATEVLALWYKLPSFKRDRPRSWYAREVIEQVGIHALALKPVTKAANRLTLSVLGIGKNAKVTKERIKDWSQRLIAHPICDPESEVSKCAYDIYDLVEAISPLNADLVSRIQTVLPPVDPELDVEMDPPPPPTFETGGFAPFVSMVDALLPFITGLPAAPAPLIPNPSPSQKSAAAQHEFITFVLTDTDKLCPFRQLGSSLSRVLQPGGPYSPNHLRTVAGLFSALLFRGVTHHTQYLLDGNPRLFEDFEAWKRVYNSLRKKHKDSRYFCDRAAYGNAAGAREVDNVAGYWAQANDPRFNFFLKAETPTNILFLFKYFLKGPKRQGKKSIPGTDQHFRAFGSLTLLQLLADYAQAGLVTKPTAAEMAYIVKVIKKGAYKGLKALGYDVSTVSTIENALSDLLSRLHSHIPTSIRSVYEFDFIFLEHALCKHGRLREHFAPLYALLKSS
ncbi:hypothetical protein GALMADRAFT_148182 [Galerina marginata CBS 339.88]|uniref:Uncharacterized protein n=1 Tax=Galerina marginata (strain CBS 339.88) TaxID=685588 RepID=A0A067SE67_GALM3|nr:hypothetical protein GALMADRAFT_148182 [Galerina marginata CBS 339.88]